MARLLTAALAALLLGALFAPVAARADGDPASDVLLGEDVFYPYTPPVTAAVQHQLSAATAAARKAKTPIKVALIASPVDLGVIPDLFGKPSQYAQFLDQEISFRAKQPLLVVMKTGYGTQGLTAKAQAAVASLPKPSGGTSTELAQAALTAVEKISAANGHPLPGVAGATGDSGGGSSRTTLIVVLLGLAALATATALGIITVRRRRQAA